jgi:hypothetical protein
MKPTFTFTKTIGLVKIAFENTFNKFRLQEFRVAVRIKI